MISHFPSLIMIADRNICNEMKGSTVILKKTQKT